MNDWAGPKTNEVKKGGDYPVDMEFSLCTINTQEYKYEDGMPPGSPPKLLELTFEEFDPNAKLAIWPAFGKNPPYEEWKMRAFFEKANCIIKWDKVPNKNDMITTDMSRPELLIGRKIWVFFYRIWTRGVDKNSNQPKWFNSMRALPDIAPVECQGNRNNTLYPYLKEDVEYWKNRAMGNFQSYWMPKIQEAQRQKDSEEVSSSATHGQNQYGPNPVGNQSGGQGFQQTPPSHGVLADDTKKDSAFDDDIAF